MKKLMLLLLIIISISCKNKEEKEIVKKKPKQIVLISKYSPEPYKHFIYQDSLGETIKEQSGPYSPIRNSTFTYFDSQNNVNYWIPKANEVDTLIIPYYREYLELSTSNRYTSISNTYLVKNGDTVIFDYKNKIPIAKIKDRKVNDIELNYNNYRLKKLFDNKYTSHYKIFLGFLLDKEQSFEETSIKYYKEALEDKKRELNLLDSLHEIKLLSNENYEYRIAALNGIMAKHKNNKLIKKWLDQNNILYNNENIKTLYSLDLAKTDSLMTFSYFRDYLNNISNYNLSFIQENNINSGAIYIDSRIRFDSILNDKRFNQTAKNLLLFIAYQGIGQNFRVKDKEKYFIKLQENTTNPDKLNKLQKKYKLDFRKSDKLILTNLKNDTITFSNVLKNNRGKWLYIDFWASWCKPCRETMQESNKLQKEFKNKNIEFIYISLNDRKDEWEQAIKLDSILKNQNYFIENGNTSKVIEDLHIKTIPHYLIYNPSGELINGYANRPGKGAKEQLENLLTKIK